MEKIVNNKVAYCTCSASGCSAIGRACPLKVYVKDGVITAIEKADQLNHGMFREDLSEDAIKAEMIQLRPCSRAFTWRRTIYHPDRAKYPMKRIGKRGECDFIRISWEEALDTIITKMKKIVDDYGPYCIYGELPVTQWLGPWGVVPWGANSFSGYLLSDLVTLGYCQGHTAVSDFEVQEFTDIFNSKLILLFGANPAVTEQENAYWLMLAKKKGIPIIIVDPVYTVSAEVYANQWIPIRPGTDLSLMLAIANVLFKEGLCDPGYIAKFVEPSGFQKWKDYVLGIKEGPDGKLDRSPEWSEKICGVPAETIKALARLYAKSKPCYMNLQIAATRQLYGENTSRAATYLQAITGNLGVSGGGPGSSVRYGPKLTIPVPSIDWKRKQPDFPADKRFLWHRAWMDSILLRKKLEKGDVKEDEYRRICGIAQDWPLPNIRMVWNQSQRNYNYSNDNTVMSGHIAAANQDMNKVFRALKEVDFVVSAVFFMKDISTLYSDIVLPLADTFFEEPRGYVTGQASNYFICGFKAIEPPEEARPLEWIMVQIANRFGVGKLYSPLLTDVADDFPNGWNHRLENLMENAYKKWAIRDDIAPREPPSWQKFRQLPIYRVPFEDKPHVAFAKNIEKGQPFDTVSGKIEFYSAFLADTEMARKSYILPRRKIDNMCCFGGSIPPTIPPISMWMLPENSMLASKAKKYPLKMLTSHSYHRQNFSQDNNPWQRDEFRHTLRLSAVDAQKRKIKDGDIIRVYNDFGEIIMPVYVTSRITPGTVVLPHGAWPEISQNKTDLMPQGIDRRGADNFLTSSKYYPWVVGVICCSELVQVERMKG
jgi:anaerobic dimethyl sulfoxide reductase subunit A